MRMNYVEEREKCPDIQSVRETEAAKRRHETQLVPLNFNFSWPSNWSENNRKRVGVIGHTNTITPSSDCQQKQGNF